MTGPYLRASLEVPEEHSGRDHRTGRCSERKKTAGVDRREPALHGTTRRVRIGAGGGEVVGRRQRGEERDRKQQKTQTIARET